MTGCASTAPDSAGRTVYIYALRDPRDGAFRYIGKTARPVDLRLKEHLREPAGKHRRSRWIQKLKRLGLKPEVVVLEQIEGAWPWQESERYWIAFAKAQGWDLVNSTAGGEGVENLTADARARIATTWKGRKHRPETIAKLKAARALRKTSDATRAKMSAAMRGREITWAAKIAVAVRKLSPEQRESILRRLEAGERVKDLAREFGVHRTTLSKVKAGSYIP